MACHCAYGTRMMIFHDYTPAKSLFPSPTSGRRCPAGADEGGEVQTETRTVYTPRGLALLQQYVDVMPYPVVAIGGIGRHNYADVRATGVSGIAMISAITQAMNPEQEIDYFNA